MPAEAPAEYTMGRGEIGGRTSISPAQQKNEFPIIPLRIRGRRIPGCKDADEPLNS
jgi:hypothetical protein